MAAHFSSHLQNIAEIGAAIFVGRRAHCAENGYDMRVLKAVEEVNERQKSVLFEKLRRHYGDLQGKTIALWGLAFKAETDDMREATSLVTIRHLLEADCTVRPRRNG